MKFGKWLLTGLGIGIAGVVFSAATAAGQEWQVTLKTTGLPVAEFKFGTDDLGTPGWDSAIEDPLPPALPNGMIAGFTVNGAPFPFITLQDYRVSGTDDAVFAFSYSLAEGGTATLDWSDGQGSAPIGDIIIKSATGAELLGSGKTMADVRTLQLKADRAGVSTIYFILGNPRPVARDDVAYMLNLGAGGTVDIDVLGNDYSPALAALEVVDPVTTAPANGITDVILGEHINYDPADAFVNQVDTFKYKVTDGVATSEEAVVTVYVNGSVVVRERAGQEPGKPGENVTVTVDIETNPVLAGLALQIVLPRTTQNPPQIWGFVGATYDDGGRGGAEIPTINNDGLGTVTLGFATLPISLTLTLAAPDARVASSPLVFDKAATSVANLETTPLPDALPDVKVPMQYGTLDVNMSGAVNITDVVFIFRRAVLKREVGQLDLTAEIVENVDGLGDLLDVNASGAVNITDVVFIFRRAVLKREAGQLDLTPSIVEAVDAMMP